MPQFNNRIKQVLLVSLIIALSFLILRELYVFLPGLLGALTLYILSRNMYSRWVYERKWRKGWTAGLLVLNYLLLIGLPVFLGILLVGPRIDEYLANPGKLVAIARESVTAIQNKFGYRFLSDSTVTNAVNKLTALIPTILNSTATLLSNFALMLFVLYHMLVNGRDLEKSLVKLIPLKQENIDRLAVETRTLVKANALGIPLISLIQGLTGMIGYLIFGVQEWALWGLLTGIFAFFPVVGTMIIWVPLVFYLYAVDRTGTATGVLIYSLIVTGNVDYLARITLLRRMGNVHPVVTILGVIVGLSLFGFIGLIFGPLLISYVVLLLRIYINEFVDAKPESASPGN